MTRSWYQDANIIFRIKASQHQANIRIYIVQKMLAWTHSKLPFWFKIHVYLLQNNEDRLECKILLFTRIYIYRGSWIAKPFDKNPWIQGAFDKQIKITAIQTQGRHDYWNWVKTYKISYSETGADWEVYKSEDGSEHVISPLFIILPYMFAYLVFSWQLVVHL